MACPTLGLEALQPLQPEPPPEPAFSEAQKWIEVGAGGCWAALQGRPEPVTRALTARRSGLASPTFFCQLPGVTGAGLSRAAPAWRIGSTVPGEGGCGWGTPQSGRARGGGKPSPAPPSSPARQSQLAPLPGAAERSAVRAKALQRRRKREPAESLGAPRFGVSRSLSHIPPPGLPPCPSGAPLAVSPSRRIPAGASGRVPGSRSGVGLAQRAGPGKPARPTCERAIRIDAGSTIGRALSVPEMEGWARRDRGSGPAGSFHILNDSGRPGKSPERSAQSRQRSLGHPDS